MHPRLAVPLLILLLVGFMGLVILNTFQRYPQIWLYIILLDLHYHLSRLGLAAAAVMAALGAYIGIIRKGDVTPLFRAATYVIVITMLLQAMVGIIMVTQGGSPAGEAHYFYGAASVLVLPFFIFIEVTAKKRPAMDSYLWGFALLLGIIIRSAMTG